MKKQRLFLLAATLLMGFGSFAQDGPSHGLRAGWSAAGLYANGNQVDDSQQSFYVGTFRTDQVKSILHWYKGLEYQQMGRRENDNNYRTLHYLSLPQAARLKIGPVFAQVGIAFNIKVGESLVKDGFDTKTDATKAEWYDFPWHVGLGLKLGPVTVDARRYWGLNDITDLGYRNQYFQIGAGISF